MKTLKQMCDQAGFTLPKDQVEKAERILCHPDGNHDFNPFDYQTDGLKLLLNDARSCLWDGPGVGKTIPMQAIILIYHLYGVRSLMVMPPKLIGNWMQALERNWTVPDDIEFEAYVSDDTPAKRQENLMEFEAKGYPSTMLMSYGRFRTDGHQLKLLGYRAFLFDEADKLCNSKTKVWTSAYLCTYTESNDIGLHMFTGSPIRKDPLDAYGLIKLRTPKKFYDFAQFYARYVAEEVTIKAKDPRSGALVDRVVGLKFRFQEELGQILLDNARQLNLRDVQQNLPPLRPIEIPVRLKGTHQKLYKGLMNTKLLELDGELINVEHASQLRQMAMRIISSPQHYVEEDKQKKVIADNEVLNTAMSIIESVNPYKNKIIIWAWYQQTVESLKELLKEYNPAVIYGAQSAADADANRIKFETHDDCGVMIANWSSGGAGFNWQMANYMLFFETPTVPRDVEQTINRMQRTGQKKSMTVYFLKVAGTLADRNYRRLLERTEDVSLVTGYQYPVQDIKQELFGEST